MAKVKTVVLMVEYLEGDVRKVFPEVVEVGGDNFYETPSQFINEMKKNYVSASKGDHKFSIINVIIG